MKKDEQSKKLAHDAIIAKDSDGSIEYCEVEIVPSQLSQG